MMNIHHFDGEISEIFAPTKTERNFLTAGISRGQKRTIENSIILIILEPSPFRKMNSPSDKEGYKYLHVFRMIPSRLVALYPSKDLSAESLECVLITDASPHSS
jgi:hypothetical protein